MNQVDRAASRSNPFRRQQRNGVGTEAGGSAGDDNGVTSKVDNSRPEDTENGERDLGVKQQKLQRLRAERKHKQQQRQQPTGAFAWEGILPQRQLKVLLVEDDDSTRHVVAALLRNCGYEVISARNGLHAWEILNDADMGVELVLTDVMMPELSGVELLGRITATETTKQTPVVMMSSVDSMDIVFKCLSKGAVDFLVKPVRKNELKNLWQHFWRKCLSSSGSGSGGSPTGKVNDNDTGSYEGSESGSSGLNVGGGSDNGSGTQSSWTKKPEVRNQPLRPNSPGDGNEDELGGREREPPDTGSGDEAARGRSLETYTEPSYQAIDLLANIKDQDKDAVAAAEVEKPPASGTDNTGLADSNSAPTLELSLKRSRPKESEEPEGEKRRVLHHSDGSAFSRYSSSGAAASTTAAAATAAAGSSFPVSLWVGLGPGGMCVTAPGDGRAGAAEEGLPGGSNTPVKGVEAEATGRKGNEHQHYPAPNMMSYDRLAAAYGESLQHLFYPQWKNMALSRKEERTTEVHHQFQDGHHHYHHHHHHHYGPGRGGGDGGGDGGTGGGKEEAAVNKNNPRAGNHQRRQQCASSNVTNVPEATAGAGGSGGSSYCLNGTGGNASVNGSNSGSNNLSNNNLQNGQSNGHSGTGLTANKGGDSGTNDVNNMNSNTNNNSSNHLQQQSNNNGSSSMPGTNNSNHDSNSGAGAVTCPESTRLTRREAALNKFRQKRKERCFEKKVRYQSRKKLAEQRPRVRGQFVKQGATAATVAELNNRDEELDDELQPDQSP